MFRLAILALGTAALAIAPMAPLAAQSRGQGNGAGNGNAFGVGNGANNGNGNGNGNGGGNGGGPPGCKNNGVPSKNPNCPAEPIALTVDTNIDFGRLVLVGDGVGRVVLDLDSGGKLFFGGIDDLGGFAVKGHATVTGSPNRAVVLNIPTTIVMADPAGGQAELRDIVTNLQSLPVLDGNGQLVFQFSGTLYTDAQTAVGGVLRGRIPISVNYN